MSLTLELPPDTEQHLRKRAADRGISLNDYVTELIQRDTLLVVQPALLRTPEERAKAWLEWASSHRPLPILANDSRESIYAGCGE